MQKIITFGADDSVQAAINDLQFRWSLESASAVIKKSIIAHHKDHFPGNYKPATQGGAN
jgi:hypothetical protein